MSRLDTRSTRVDVHVLIFLGVAIALAACGGGFRPQNYANPEALFRASLLEFQQRHWENAQVGFERLSNDLSARDPLLAPAYFYLALSHENRKEYLLAAQSFQRVTDGFPDDTLAARAMLGVGRSYQLLWRRPNLDQEYGLKALSTLRALLASYPDAVETAEAKTRIAQVEEWLAEKDYLTGIHYMRVRRTVDPAIIYFKDVVTTYPKTKAARLSWLKLHELYTKIRWREDAAETCTAMWTAYPGDADVAVACGSQPKDTTSAAGSTPSTASMVPPVAVRSPLNLARPGPR